MFCYGALKGPGASGAIAAAGVIPVAAGANWWWVAISVVSAVTVLAAMSTLAPWRRKMISRRSR